jgi:hypothetical protein
MDYGEAKESVTRMAPDAIHIAQLKGARRRRTFFLLDSGEIIGHHDSKAVDSAAVTGT